jgi:site-specific DNA-methyltransferase (adenine-specific)
MKSKQIENTKVTSLIADDKNFNKGSENGAEMIRKSFQKFGSGRSILIDKNNRIIAGNKSVEFSGIEDVLIVESDGTQLIAVKRTDIDLDSPQGREMALADNASAKANIVFDAELIEAELGEAVCEEWGIDVATKLEAVEDDFDVDSVTETDIVLGDLFEIGEHRLMCGDSTDSDSVALLMNGSKADMVFTDPPYGVNMNRSGKILNDNLNNDDLYNLLNSAFVNSILFSKDCHFYWWIGFKGYSLMEKCFIDNDIKIDNCIVWNKPSIGLGKTGYRYKHELCLFKGEIKDKSLSDVWDFGRDREGLHPTMKPIELISYAMNNSSKIDDLVLDLFLGSGSTMVASHQLKRKCYGMELDPKYCEVIIQRMKKLDPSLIIKRNGINIT